MSIRKQLLIWLLVPLSVLLVFSSVFAYFLADTVSNYCHDRALVKSAMAVAARLEWGQNHDVSVDMPPAAQAILRFSDEDQVYYQVLRQDQTRISGDAVIPGPLLNPGSKEPTFRDCKLEGVPIRIARIRSVNPNSADDAVYVQVAETLSGRDNITRILLASIITPQILLIALSSIAVWFGIGKGLTPLKTIEKSVIDRNPHDLSPLVFSRVPVEVEPLVESINDLLERLRREIESQQRFVANAAHQLRTPLAGLRTYVDVTSRLSTDVRILQLLNKIDCGIDRMAHLVNRLLSLAKAEPQKKLNIGKTLVDLNLIANSSTASFLETAISKGISLTFHPAPAGAFVTGNIDALQDLTSNLIENAVFYTHAGGNVSVRVSNDDGIKFSVEDDGPGIPMEERERVFERFYRILGTGVSGSGLGLSIVQEIAQAHNALVYLGDGPQNHGTLVRVDFPDVSRHNNQPEFDNLSVIPSR